MAMIHGFIYTCVAIALLTWVGNWACRILFAATGLKNESSSSESDAQPAGRIIGWLERIVFAIGIVTQSWEVLAAVIALKTVARFQELDDQKFAEYFLVGSLFSILWAILITNAWLIYDRQNGSDLQMRVASIFEITEQSTNTCTTSFTHSHIIEFGNLCSGEMFCAIHPSLCIAQEIGVELEDERTSAE